jgi:hypothetical protein
VVFYEIGGHPLFIFVWAIGGGVNCEWFFGELVQTFCEGFVNGLCVGKL